MSGKLEELYHYSTQQAKVKYSILFKKEVVDTGDPATGRETDSDTLQGAS